MIADLKLFFGKDEKKRKKMVSISDLMGQK
jgi:hypothetical protein